MIGTKTYNRIKYSASILEKVCHVIFIAFIVAGILTLIGILIVALLPSKAFDLSPAGVREAVTYIQESFGYGIRVEDVSSLALKPVLLAFLPVMLLGIVFYDLIFMQLWKLLRSIAMEQPFAPENANRLSFIGYVLLIGAFVLETAYYVLQKVIIHQLDVAWLKVQYGFNFTMILMGLLLLILSGVFKAGNYLQNEYDETV